MAFLSSRIEETESKLLSAARSRVEFRGLLDVVTGSVSRLEEELVCSFNLVADVNLEEPGSLCMTLTDQHSWKGTVWMVWVRYRGGEPVSIHMV